MLLTLHAKARAWYQMGGHCEPDDATLAAAARREAVEESGTDGLVLDPVPVHLDAHEVPFCGGAGGARHLDVRFVAVAADGASPRASEESLELRWWPVDALPPSDLDALVGAALARVAQSAAGSSPKESSSAGSSTGSR